MFNELNDAKLLDELRSCQYIILAGHKAHQYSKLQKQLLFSFFLRTNQITVEVH